jgi:hypothetical protein
MIKPALRCLPQLSLLNNTHYITEAETKKPNTFTEGEIEEHDGANGDGGFPDHAPWKPGFGLRSHISIAWFYKTRPIQSIPGIHPIICGINGVAGSRISPRVARSVPCSLPDASSPLHEVMQLISQTSWGLEKE